MLFPSRNKPRYEVLTLSNGRWSKRDSLLEKSHAIAKARTLSQSDKSAEAIRVVEALTNRNGTVTEKQVLVIDKPEAFQRTEFQVGKVTEVQPCTELADIFKLDARRVMERLLRPYLGSQGLTPTEFLHIASYHKQIERQGNLVEVAAHTSARLQHNIDGCAIAERKELILSFGDQIREAARTFGKASGNLPTIASTGFLHAAEAARAAAPEGKGDFWVTAIVCLDLTQHRAVNDKLNRLINLFTGDEPGSGQGLGILDKIFADTLLAPDSLREMLGPQVCLLAQIDLCLSILKGDFKGKTVFGSDFMMEMSRLMASGICPDSAQALRMHLIRALSSSNPLDHREADADAERARLLRLKSTMEAMPVLKSDWPAIADSIERRNQRIANGW
jgi:hypothetical protein